MKRVTVAIDGPAGSGKSTVAREVARILEYIYVDTGAMYRAAALKARRNDIAADDDAGLRKMLGDTGIELVPDGDRLRVLLDGQDVSSAIRTEQAGMDASAYSKSPAVRERLVEIQRRMGGNGGVVMEGRDIGTVVFPEAECKFFIDASPEERARRRALELEARGERVEVSNILEQARVRDAQDSSRALAPLKPAPDAIIIDTTGISIKRVVQKVLAAVPGGANRVGINHSLRQRGTMEPMDEKKENQATQPEPGASVTPAQDAVAQPTAVETAAPAAEVTGDTTPDAPSSPEVEEGKHEGPSFSEMFEESIRQPEDGEIIKGTVVRVGKEHVMVDIGFKSEGQIDVAEFTDSNGVVNISPGDLIEVLIDRREDENGIIRLSKEKADKVRVWDDLDKAHHSGEPVEGKIVGKVKGGMTVDIGVRAFLPGSQVDLRPTRNLDSFVGQTGSFKILKFNRKRGNVVVSRRMVLEDDRASKRSETLKHLEKGRILTGAIKNIVDYGAFIDLGGIDGLLHVTDMSWGRIKHPSDMLQVGQEVKVVVLKFDNDNERVSLGLKQITPDPWDTITEKYPVGAKVVGKVVSITDYGAFIELEPGVEGLVHVSEMSWTRRVRHPSKIVQIGQEVEVMVLDLDMQNRRISLGLKQVEPNPWDVVADKYPPETIIRGRIRNITDFGIFIGVAEGIDGLVHISDMSWTKRIKHPSELFKKGQEVEAMVLNIDKENERFSLGIKQLTKDPWEDIRNRIRPGDSVMGKVVNVTDFGVFLELEEGIEGLIHVSELGQEKSKNPAEHFKAGDELKVEILNIDPSERKIRLSLKALEDRADQEEIKQYAAGRGSATVKIGDLLGDHLRAAKAAANAKKTSDEQEAAQPMEEEKHVAEAAPPIDQVAEAAPDVEQVAEPPAEEKPSGSGDVTPEGGAGEAS